MLRRRRPLLLSPARWPVRWRLAGVSAALTFVILLVFGAVVGRLAQERLESDFSNQLERTATDLAFSFQINPVTERPVIDPAEFERMAIANDATISVVDGAGHELLPTANPRPLPPPVPGTVRQGDLEIATRQISSNLLTPVYVQYARDHDRLDATIDRLWLFLGIGVGGGALLATLAGLWIANRAMRPIAALTATAREIATTRDAHAGGRRRGGGAGAHPRLDAGRARRGARRGAADGPRAARVHRRRVA